jgi:hypothetical protein
MEEISIDKSVHTSDTVRLRLRETGLVDQMQKTRNKYD